MKHTESFKRDNLLTEYLLAHKGIENAVTRHDIAKYLSENVYKQKPSTVHTIIYRIIRERHLPICSKQSYGYFCAKTKYDILTCIDELQARADSLLNHINHLKNFIME